jgi:mono/diheme cytochrome c family protein
MLVRRLVTVAAVLAAAGCSHAKHGDPAAVAADVSRGRAVFTAQCSACHGTSGKEGGIGPALAAEKSRKDAAAVKAWIENPSPPMPKLWPGTLSDADLADVTAYVETL